MKLVTFLRDDAPHLGIRTERGIIDVSVAAAAWQEHKQAVPETIMEVIEQGDAAIEALQRLEHQALASGETKDWLMEESQLTYAPCVTNPGKIICIGLNYRRHAEETNSPIPVYPIVFNKFNNTLTAHGSDVVLPAVSTQVDYEAELAIVMGRAAKNVPEEEALDYVFGYCNVNDLSARDLQFRTGQWLLGKTCDGFSPLGPYLVTADEVGDPQRLAIRTTVNGELRQHSSTSDMIFGCGEIVSYLSRHMTLLPGDIILTGTPEGVVMGYPEAEQQYLQAGDLVEVEIEKLGVLTNRMVAEV
ncbi:5-carboxymethyl-2-hydroxymuconate isomerase [Paenibacillus sp. 598K]|uniref:fumarylacetoacetate hydrolase family protein n=1 Tax=Paenibacillus sp. 598K TaxID=1117987 RepID=UPI000FF9CA40|nr:fumarylacetoacetate hydrolase family protein [Paenibacillus sp. 598K]GBF72501.1 5-carboxymethyl-2-hydroxymuconate isomerase [Paenibacillus sp. 598K]